MAIVYKGNCEWRMIRKSPSRAAKGLPIHSELWIGRYDKFEAFLAAHPLGSVLSGGYIIHRRADDSEPRSEVEFTVATAPDFNAYSVTPSQSIKTSTKSATIASSAIIPDAESVDATRSVSYYAPETRYRYFASARPGGPRFSVVADGRQPRIIRSVLTASGTPTSGPNAGVTVERTWGSGSAPAPLVAGLSMPPQDHVTGHEASPIDGTPWYECVDVVSRELEGDA